MKLRTIRDEMLVQRLQHPNKKIRMVIDTDTYNEIDDQFAITYAMYSLEHFTIEAFYAAPFYNSLSNSPKDGMEKSFFEIKKIQKIFDNDQTPVFKGSNSFMQASNEFVESDAARDLIDRALASSQDDPLYVVAIGAITNIASAIIMEPKIIENIIVIWLGGHSLHWSNTKEFNLYQDLHASRIILNSSVPLVLVPCDGVVSHLTVTLPELEENIKASGEIGQYLYETFKRYKDHRFLDENIKRKGSYSRVLWDLAPIAYLINHSWTQSSLIPAPILSEDYRWSFDPGRHLIRYINYIDRDSVIGDLYKKIKRNN